MARLARPGNMGSCLSLPHDPTSAATLRWRPLRWGTIRWRLFTSTFCSIVVIVWALPASTWALAVPKEKVSRNTSYGEIQGYVGEVLPGKFVEYYLGVPYAAPPIGDLRFANPVEPKPWEGIRVTNKYPPACMQNYKYYVNDHRVDFDEYDEDCLYLNIYVPRVTKKELLPVFAWVHGGSNIVGMAAMHDGDVFASHTDVIVVMMNYRLAALGFLTLADSELPGNYGIMDQLLALKWIQKNIEFFGGDKTKVTLSGHSAGSGDVGLHTLSSFAKGLFRFSICQSGSSTAHWAMLRPNEKLLKSVKDYVDRMDCLKETSLEIKRCLRKQPAKVITSTWIQTPPSGYSFYVTDNGYVTDTPEKLFARGPVNFEVMMMGVTKDEGTIAGLQVPETFDTKAFKSGIIRDIASFPRVPHIDDLIIHEYLQWENDPLKGKVSGRISVSEVFGDYYLTYPTVQCLELLAKRNLPVYFYTFYHRSTEDKRPDWAGVPHGEDVFYLFGSPLVGHPLRNYTDVDKEVSKKFMTFFGNFVKTGKAFIGTQVFKHYTTKEKLNVKFYSENNTAMVRHDNNYRPRKMAFWGSLITTLENKTAIDEKRRKSKEHNQAEKLFLFQSLTWFFVSLSLVLVFTASLFLFMLLKRKRDPSILVSSQNTDGNGSEGQPVGIKQGTAHLMPNETKQHKNTFSPTKG